MKRWHWALLTRTLLGTMILSFLVSGSAAADDYQDLMIEYLEIGPATYLNLAAHGESAADIDKILLEIYHDNDLQPFWIEQGQPSQRAMEIYSVLKDAARHGLDPDSYFINQIEQVWKSKETAGLVKLDILLSVGMMRYVADQREGRLQPRQIDPKLFATASDVTVDWDILKTQAFNAPDMKVFMEQQAPPFFQYEKLKEQLAEYRTIAAKGGWPAVPDGQVLKPGMEDQRVQLLKRRLAVTGASVLESLDSNHYDADLVGAVKTFQKHHNLAVDGVIGKQTLTALNVPVNARIDQIIINMERYRWLKRLKEERLVAVNIASFEAFAGKPGSFDVRMPVIVGQLYHKTPVFSDTIKYVVFNPYWNLTPSIARNETLPRLKKDPTYLQKHNMRIFNGWGPEAAELDPLTIDWSQVSKKQMNRYRVRQDPGPNNALGILKLVFPNKYNVYLHDTPAHSLFREAKRAFSHGCIRMDRPAEMAAWVLGGEAKGWNVERVNKIVASKKRQVARLEQPMPVYILYRTAYVDPEDSTLYFSDDLYGRDRLLKKALLGGT